MADYLQSKASTHPVIVPEVAGKKPARAIECLGHDAQGFRIIDRLDPARRIHVRSFSTGLRKSCRASHMREVTVAIRTPLLADLWLAHGRPAKMICCKVGFFMPMNWSFGGTEHPEIPARFVIFCSEGCSGIFASRTASRSWPNLQSALTLADELQMGTLAYLIERALDEARSAQFASLASQKPPMASDSRPFR
jgi:hypothetical protein